MVSFILKIYLQDAIITFCLTFKTGQLCWTQLPSRRKERFLGRGTREGQQFKFSTELVLCTEPLGLAEHRSTSNPSRPSVRRSSHLSTHRRALRVVPMCLGGWRGRVTHPTRCSVMSCGAAMQFKANSFFSEDTLAL